MQRLEGGVEGSVSAGEGGGMVGGRLLAAGVGQGMETVNA